MFANEILAAHGHAPGRHQDSDITGEKNVVKNFTSATAQGAPRFFIGIFILK